MSCDLSPSTTDLELRNFRHRVSLHKIVSGPMLAAVNGCAPGSLFFKVIRNGVVQCMTQDPVYARDVFRSSCRSVGISTQEAAL